MATILCGTGGDGSGCLFCGHDFASAAYAGNGKATLRGVAKVRLAASEREATLKVFSVLNEADTRELIEASTKREGAALLDFLAWPVL